MRHGRGGGGRGLARPAEACQGQRHPGRRLQVHASGGNGNPRKVSFVSLVERNKNIKLESFAQVFKTKVSAME